MQNSSPKLDNRLSRMSRSGWIRLTRILYVALWPSHSCWDTHDEKRLWVKIMSKTGWPKYMGAPTNVSIVTANAWSIFPWSIDHRVLIMHAGFPILSHQNEGGRRVDRQESEGVLSSIFGSAVFFYYISKMFFTPRYKRAHCPITRPFLLHSTRSWTPPLGDNIHRRPCTRSFEFCNEYSNIVISQILSNFGSLLSGLHYAAILNHNRVFTNVWNSWQSRTQEIWKFSVIKCLDVTAS